MSAKIDAPSQEMAAPAAATRERGLILANKQLWLLYGGQALTNATYYLYVILLTVWVFDLTHSGVTISAVLAATSLSPFLLGPLAGVCIDRCNRPAIYLSALLASAASSCIMPAKSGILQAIVPERHQTQAAY